MITTRLLGGLTGIRPAKGSAQCLAQLKCSANESRGRYQDHYHYPDSGPVVSAGPRVSRWQLRDLLQGFWHSRGHLPGRRAGLRINVQWRDAGLCPPWRPHPGHTGVTSRVPGACRSGLWCGWASAGGLMEMVLVTPLPPTSRARQRPAQPRGCARIRGWAGPRPGPHRLSLCVKPATAQRPFSIAWWSEQSHQLLSSSGGHGPVKPQGPAIVPVQPSDKEVESSFALTGNFGRPRGGCPGAFSRWRMSTREGGRECA